jgi:hypothetical protein
MPDVFGMPQEKAANTASRLGSRYDANTAWNSLDASSPWQAGLDRYAQYSQHLKRPTRNQINITPDDVSFNLIQRNPSSIEMPSAVGPGEVMRLAQNFPKGITDTIMSPLQNLAGKFMG